MRKISINNHPSAIQEAEALMSPQELERLHTLERLVKTRILGEKERQELKRLMKKRDPNETLDVFPDQGVDSDEAFAGDVDNAVAGLQDDTQFGPNNIPAQIGIPEAD